MPPDPIVVLTIDELSKLSEEMLEIAKAEAEKLIEQQHGAEGIINGKVMSMLQVLFPVVVAVLGFIIDRMINLRFDLLLLTSVAMEVVMILATVCFYRSMSVSDVIALGTRPRKIAVPQLTKKEKAQQKAIYTKNRILNLQDAIDHNSKILKDKTGQFALGYEILLQGAYLVIAMFLLLYISFSAAFPESKYISL